MALLFISELINTLLFCYIAAEWLLPTRPSPLATGRRTHLVSVGAALAFHVIARFVTQLAVVHWLDWFLTILDAMAMLPMTLLVTAVLALVIFALLAPATVGEDCSGRAYPTPVLGAPALAFILVWACGLHRAIDPVLILKMDIVATCYIGCMYWDLVLSSKVYVGEDFLPTLVRSVSWVLLLFPLLAVGAALVCLLIAAVVDLVAPSHDFLNTPIYFVILYGPFFSLYFVARFRARRNAINLPQ